MHVGTWCMCIKEKLQPSKATVATPGNLPIVCPPACLSACLSACLHAVKPSFATCTSPDFSHNSYVYVCTVMSDLYICYSAEDLSTVQPSLA